MSDVILICLWSLFGVIGAVTDEVKSVLVYEGESVTLHTDTKIQSSDKILWRFEEADSANLLVQMHGNKIPYNDYVDGRFRERLQISDSQTGDLTIKNMRIKHTGVYEAEIHTDTGASYKRFKVTVKESPRVIDVKSFQKTEGGSVTLPTDVQTQRGDLILWRFGDKNVLIAKSDMEDNEISYDDDDDGRFRDRLMLNNQTGDLTITNIINSNTGVYKLKISSNRRDTLYKTFSVSVSGGDTAEDVAIQLWPQLAVLALTGVAAVAAVIVLGYDIKSRRDEQKRKQTPTTSDE